MISEKTIIALLDFGKSPLSIAVIPLVMLAWFLAPLRMIPSKIDMVSEAVQQNTRSIDEIKQEALFQTDENQYRINNHAKWIMSLADETGMATAGLPYLYQTDQASRRAKATKRTKEE